ncbi:MAG: glucosaminidase domain-containing protein [Fusobacterium sp.]|nr:glucosaminidase domain-containing protein [Fusobacterium sp.]MDO5789404.1 glucosaminidase domain-containing protein [Fusobacterium sp.]
MRLQKLLTCIFIFLLGTFLYGENSIPKVEYKKVELNSLEDINTWKNSNELYVFTNVNVDLRELSTITKKNTFIAILLPAIDVVNAEIKNNREIVKTLSQKENLTPEEQTYLENLFKTYRVEYGNFDELNYRLIIYPTSLILTQGAIESAWATSRFFREGNNLFGVWSTNPNEPRIPAKGVRDNGFVPHLKKYESVKDSVSDFVLNLSRNNSYKTLRKLLNENQPPQVVAQGLIKYSEEGEKYVKKVINTMNYNEFTKYDNYNK